MQPVITIESTHPLVLLADEIDWTRLTGRVGCWGCHLNKLLRGLAGRRPAALVTS
jgi:hypothetical protein